MKLRLITGVCFAVFFSDTSLVFGQKTLVDSLTHQLTLVTREDSDRVKILNELSDRTYRNDPDLASVYAKESIQIAHKISYLKGEAEGNHLLGLPHFYRENTDSAAYYFKKALELYEKIGDRRGAAGVEASLGATYALSGNFKKATEFSIRALVIYEELENYAAIAIMYNNIGNLYSD